VEGGNQTNKQSIQQANRQTNRQITNKCNIKETNKQTNKQTKQPNRQSNQTSKQTTKQTNKQSNKQTNNQTLRPSHLVDVPCDLRGLAEHVKLLLVHDVNPHRAQQLAGDAALCHACGATRRQTRDVVAMQMQMGRMRRIDSIRRHAMAYDAMECNAKCDMACDEMGLCAMACDAGCAHACMHSCAVFFDGSWSQRPDFGTHTHSHTCTHSHTHANTHLHVSGNWQGGVLTLAGINTGFVLILYTHLTCQAEIMGKNELPGAI
jgi:hypothetical protein